MAIPGFFTISGYYAEITLHVQYQQVFFRCSPQNNRKSMPDHDRLAPTPCLSPDSHGIIPPGINSAER
jgi:hypothetical protein